MASEDEVVIDMEEVSDNYYYYNHYYHYTRIQQMNHCCLMVTFITHCNTSSVTTSYNCTDYHDDVNSHVTGELTIDEGGKH